MFAGVLRSRSMHSKHAYWGSLPCTDAADRIQVTPRDEPTEPLLAERALRGDPQAWRALVAQHDHRVVVSLLARGLPLAEARELAQQTWTKLLAQQRAGRLERLELPGLAIRQAEFLALDAARRARIASEPSDPIDPIDPAASAEARLIRREELARVRDELARCAPKAQQLFALLAEHPGMPHAEAARRLGLSTQRVRQILCEVRARLRAALETEPR